MNESPNFCCSGRAKSAKLVAFIGLALVIGGTLLFWQFSGPLDPVIRGQRLSKWLLVLANDPEGTDSYNRAVEAVREAGPKGLPLMVRMLQTKDSFLVQFAARLLRNQHVIHPKWTREWDVRLAALRGLKLLGPQAESVAPRLGELMSATNFTMEATVALLHMGRPALAEFGRALTNQEPMVRNWAAIGIRQLHNEQGVGWGTRPGDATWDKELVRPLLQLSTDSQTPGARGALAAIVRTSPNTAVPEISKALGDADLNIREEAARFLLVANQFQTKQVDEHSK
ncbi:MAG: HEAT repeat domain-containing protein [Limisphaerales bacterium]